MKKIKTPNYIAKNNKNYEFELKIDKPEEEESEYYMVNLMRDNDKIGSITLSNTQRERFSEVYQGKYGNIKFIENNQIAETGLVVENDKLKIVNKKDYKDFIENVLCLEDVSFKNDEREILTAIRDFIKPEKELIKARFNKPQIVSVYIPDGTDGNEYNQEEDLRGLGIGKKLYEYATQWMGANNLKVYTQDLRSKDAINIWKSFKKDPKFNYTKEDDVDSIVRYDGIELKNEIEEILKKKISESKINKKSRNII
jgi:GNAT superfamily N-acetyltransferase